MDSPIRYLKLIGGPKDCEAVLIGLKNGGVYQVFVNNPFPQLLAKQNGVIYCVDMNVNRTKVAIIDDTLTLFVYNVHTKELLYQVTPQRRSHSILNQCVRSGTECANRRLEYVFR